LSKVLVFLAPGFEEIEACTIIDILRRCGIEVHVMGLVPKKVSGSHGMIVIPDQGIEDIIVDNFDAVICPGGYPGYENLRKNPLVLKLLKEAHNQGKIVAAICGAPAVLSDAGILKGKACTIYPGMEDELRKGGGIPKAEVVVVDDNIITSQGPATAFAFSFKLAEKLTDKNVVEKIIKATLADIALR
jgi:4-methyl-5(b-hydroxyethyl)-thiazole monophosphate biosynthesis